LLSVVINDRFRLPSEVTFPVFKVNVQPAKYALMDMCRERVQTETSIVRETAHAMALAIIQDFDV